MSDQIAPELIEMLRCPLTRSALKVADPALVQGLNEQVAIGELVNHAGQQVGESLDAGLINEAGTLLLPIRGGIVILVEDQAIPLAAQ